MRKSVPNPARPHHLRAFACDNPSSHRALCQTPFDSCFVIGSVVVRDTANLSGEEHMNLQYNFSGGPGALPLPVLMQAQQAILEVPEVGLSVLGISHRSDWFREVMDEAEANIRHLLKVPQNYHVLFLQGGSTLQFAMLAMNFGGMGESPPSYVSSGYWSRKSMSDSG